MLSLKLPDTNTATVNWNRLYGSSLALSAIEAIKQHKNGPVVFIVDDIAHADSIRAQLSFYNSGVHTILHLPDWETLPYDIFSPHQDIVSKRLKTLNALQNIGHGDILILPINTLLQKLSPKSYIRSNVLIFKTGQRLDIQSFRRELENNGYLNVSQVMEHGEFAVRGSIIDLFPAGSDAPFRIDLFDDEIETIRVFDKSSQRSLHNVDNIELLPAREFSTNDEAITKFRERYRQQVSGDPLKSIIYNSVSEKIMPTGIEYYLPLFFESLASIFDYLPKSTLFIQPNHLDESIKQFWVELTERHEQRRHDIERPILAPNALYNDLEQTISQLNAYTNIITSTHSSTNGENNLNVKHPPEIQLQTQLKNPSEALDKFLAQYHGRILFVAETPGRREVLTELLRDHKIYPSNCETWNDFTSNDNKICITVAELERGLYLLDPEITVITESQIYGQRALQKRRRKQKAPNPETIIKNLTDLNIGSPVVHIDHGVGRYLGLQKLKGFHFETEFLTIEYAGDDKLYVPVTSLHLISRFTGTAPEKAPLHRLGGEQWSKAKNKAAKQARDIAAELLDIHARRAAVQGRCFTNSPDEYASFVSKFPFEETPDQEAAIQNVLDDLASQQPMDRIICGDVGFGKTEVAMRAAFTVANNSHQVAVLVPTTLLANQHFQNFCDRFADWPIKVKCLSRFNTAKQQREILEEIEKGTVDIIIGTHKLLQKTVKFKNLGLVIIDEEHRFGVRHKEQLKSMRAEIDILTLTATPIPRTLNMSLAGIRDLSIISTPPVSRLSINTFVTEWSDSLITEACQRELKRGGQIYVLHNEVKTIEKFAQEIQTLVPEARVEFAHGQMPEQQLEQVMLDFYHQRFNILVCTTIIESGIDVPTANTIIINNANKLGLSQLHQIRGRVGRSHHRAYAYMITPPASLITKDAQKRLDAIESLEDLGVGFTLATHDLEIRGAGELLGENQSGQISEVGFSLYSELLERAVKSLKEGKIPDPDAPLGSGIEINLGIPAVIPDDYVYDIHIRLILYKRIASAKDTSELDELRVEFIDRFGLLPEPLKNLFSVTELKLIAETIGITNVDANEEGAKIVFNQSPKINPSKLIELIQTKPLMYKFNGSDTLRIKKEFNEEDNRASVISDIVLDLTIEKEAA